MPDLDMKKLEEILMEVAHDVWVSTLKKLYPQKTGEEIEQIIDEVLWDISGAGVEDKDA